MVSHHVKKTRWQVSEGVEMISLKMLRERLCVLQTNVPEFRDKHTIQLAIDMIDFFRPLGTDGKHGTSHTLFCGCEEKGGLWL